MLHCKYLYNSKAYGNSLVIVIKIPSARKIFETESVVCKQTDMINAIAISSKKGKVNGNIIAWISIQELFRGAIGHDEWCKDGTCLHEAASGCCGLVGNL